MVQSVERAAALLRAVAAAAGTDATASSLAATVGLNRTTTWRILTTLEQQRLVSLDRRTGRYSLGFGLVDLAGQASSTSLVRASRSVLQRIAKETGETAALAMLRDGALVYVAEAVGGAIVSVSFQGQPVPLHATSTGKVLLAWSGDDEVRALLNLPPGGRLERFTAATIGSRAALGEELARTRKRGFSVCRGEFEESAWGVSAPVLDSGGRPVAVVSIWGPPERITARRFTALGALAVAGATELTGR
ncbi:IclR family transcriptional regulator [Nocardioides mangrovi]|uniref:IclR family transcriptional regulator n=1 Tax=Nocardioides mangrovi TaxID=2874580 RepID=A0ABS7UAM6_9ACTN|nr:IclR family transcriptional regulator [Nocardioides mangrovi]MBZ5737743.1 IclR family transcriptional regulator [Nocardioides mangrovi]